MEDGPRSPGISKQVAGRGILIYLQVTPVVAAERVGDAADRPILHGGPVDQKLADLLARREKYYLRAEHTVKTDGLTDDPGRADRCPIAGALKQSARQSVQAGKACDSDSRPLSAAAWPAAKLPGRSPTAASRSTLHEMRPVVPTPAHQTDRLAELVCSNSFKIARDRQRARPAQGRAAHARQPAARVRRRGAGAGRLGARRRSRRVFATRRTRGSTPIPTSPFVAARSPSCPSAGHRRDRSAHVRALGRAISRPAGHRRARVLRRHRADRERRVARSRRAVRALALRQRAKATDYLNAPMSREQYEAFIDALIDRRPVPRPRVRRGALLRGLPAGRGDGQARPGDAALRADEAGRACRSAHRPRPVGRGAAPARGQGRADVEPGRLPDPAPDSRAAAGVPDDPRARERRVPALRQHPPEHATSTRRRHWAQGSRTSDGSGLFFAGQLTGVEGYTESLGTGILAGINLARHLDGEPPAVPPPTTMLGALYRYLRDADPKHFQPMNANFGLLEPLEGKVKKDEKKRERSPSVRSRSSQRVDEHAVKVSRSVESARSDLVDEFLTHLAKERDHSPHTVAAYRRDLAAFAEFCDRHYGTDWDCANGGPPGSARIPRVNSSGAAWRGARRRGRSPRCGASTAISRCTTTWPRTRCARSSRPSSTNACRAISGWRRPIGSSRPPRAGGQRRRLRGAPRSRHARAVLLERDPALGAARAQHRLGRSARATR